MPRQRLPSSLYRICLDYVAGNVRILYPDNAAVDSILPAAINEQIFDMLIPSEPNNFPFLLQVLGGALRRVALPPGTPLVEQAAISVFSQLSQNIEHLVVLQLVLAKHHFVAFDALLSKFLALRSLTLWLDELPEPFVDAVARYCTHLRQLCLYKIRRGCYNRALGVRDNRHVIELSLNLVVKILRSLSELQIFRTSCLATAMLNLPSTARLKLTELVAVEHNILDSPRALSHITVICPMLTTVRLLLTTGRDITPLSRLAFLDDLFLFTIGEADVSFMDLIEPLLQLVGSNLRQLRLFISDLDINCIIRLCPALCSLILEGLERLVNYSRLTTRSLCLLQRFKLSLHVMSSVHPNRPFEFLQDYGQLREVSLCRCHLADSALQQLVSSGTFSRLQKLQLTEVHGVTMEGLRDLVLAQNDLVLLYIRRCTDITLEHVGVLQTLALGMNLNLKIYFSPASDQWT